MDSLITAAGRALARGDVLGALKRVALRNGAPALALRGIAMAQLGEFERAKELLERAARGFAPKEAVARARCAVALAELALAWPASTLGSARRVLEPPRDFANSAHARPLQVRRLVLIGKLDDPRRLIRRLDPVPLTAVLRAAYELTAAGIAIRLIRARSAEEALARAKIAAHEA